MFYKMVEPNGSYLMSLRNKYEVLGKGKLATTDSTRNIDGTVLGKEFVGVHVYALENNGNGNNGDEMLSRPLFLSKLQEMILACCLAPFTYKFSLILNALQFCNF